MKTRGMFTLIEMLMVMAIASLMLAIAVGPMTRAISDEQFKASARYVNKVVMLARQEAVVKRRRVAVIFPHDGNFVATCYVNKLTNAFEGWTPGKATVWMATIGLVDGPYVTNSSGAVVLAHSKVTGIPWTMPNPPMSDCPAIIFRPSGMCYSADGMVPNIVRIKNASRSESGTVTMRSAEEFTFEVNYYTGRGKFLAGP